MKFKIFFLILIIALGTLAYFSYPIIKNRYFVHKTIEIKNNPVQQKSSQIDESDVTEKIKSSVIDVTVAPSDCDNGCANFQKNEDLEYCRQVCGMSNISQEDTIIEQPAIGCASTTNGLQKDYCLKDLAVKNKDYEICNQINDTGIKETCKNRITEDILENQLQMKN